ncbi:MAG: FAD-binding oxidoreductase [Acidimicrobiaceae bacterium]|nr:FAD-binding oxidoreductase [Acidimicrobiaceae bacterium]
MTNPSLIKFIETISAKLDEGAIVDDPELISPFTTDWTQRVKGNSDLLVRPKDHQGVVDVVKAAIQCRVKLQIQGGNTSLSGGSVPQAGEVLLSLSRLNSRCEVDPDTLMAKVDAGVTLERLQREAMKYHLMPGVDLASRGSATIGGMAATNAGGLHVLRYGSMRSSVVSLRCVWGDGTESPRNIPLAKDNSGISFSPLVVGSEGTLAVITELSLRLVPVSASRAVAVVPFMWIPEAVSFAGKVRRMTDSISAIEMISKRAIRVVEESKGVIFPIKDPFEIVLLLEIASNGNASNELTEILDGSLDESQSQSTLLGMDGGTLAGLWFWRESITEAIQRRGEPLKLDLSVPIAALGELWQSIDTIQKGLAGRLEVVRFGHLGDGNIHVNLLGAEDILKRAEVEIYQLVAGLDGSITAEHGIGTLKKEFLQLVRTERELARMRELIEIFNPGRTLNPNVLL